MTARDNHVGFSQELSSEDLATVSCERVLQAELAVHSGAFFNVNHRRYESLFSETAYIHRKYVKMNM